MNNASLSFSNQLYSSYQVMSPRTSFDIQSLLDLEATDGTTRTSDFYDGAGGGFVTLRQTTNGFSNRGHTSGMGTLVYSTAPLFSINGTQIAGPASVAGTTTSLTLGRYDVNSPFKNYFGDHYFCAIYAASDSGATITANEAILNKAFFINTKFKKMVVSGGCSHNVSWQTTLADTRYWQAGFGRNSADDGFYAWPALPDFVFFNMGVGGRTIATEFGAKTNYAAVTGWFAGLSKYIFIIDSPTNDIGVSSYTSTALAQTAADNIYNNDTVPLVTYLKTVGFTQIIVSTCMPRTGFTLGSVDFREDARVRYNSNVTGGGVTNGYIVNDVCALGPFSTQTSFSNTTYYNADGVHPNSTGYGVLAIADRAVILSA
ncbi:MAG: SGNH/GDSL hydrolase family protein [Pseudomonadota bacterium]|nr:SGNH/GDSL hydrolase family protein [Pseudomonadota bacterium]